MKYPFATVLFLIIAISFTGSNGFAQTASRGDLLREIKAKRAELQQLENQLLAPTAEDRKAYAEFLSQPNTGLIRLLPHPVYDRDTYGKNNKTISMRGGGAYYSFASLTHEYGFGSDIQLESDHLSVGGAGADYGILFNLGEVALDKLKLEDPRVRSMSDYTPPSKESDARREARKFGPSVNDIGRTALPLDMGFTNRLPEDLLSYPDMFPSGSVYRSRLRVLVNSTYLLRSINYLHSDVLVAFKVVRRDSDDGSVILVWKRLKKYPVPQLALGK
ncbi:MAG: hypothetical protein ND895_25370 [Pyrinomonadaceae bacterium]|nr:hypothetical protein [Pyrinomonadaceae bacterium]